LSFSATWRSLKKQGLFREVLLQCGMKKTKVEMSLCRLSSCLKLWRIPPFIITCSLIEGDKHAVKK